MIRELISVRNHEHAVERVARSVERILNSTSLGSLATVTAQRYPHVNTVYFCWTDILELFFLSDPATIHGKNLRARPDAAMAVFSTKQNWEDDHAGLQLFGRCVLAEGPIGRVAQRRYSAQFPEYRKWFQQLGEEGRRLFQGRFYVFTASRLKVLDEAEFGEEVFVEASVSRGAR